MIHKDQLHVQVTDGIPYSRSSRIGLAFGQRHRSGISVEVSDLFIRLGRSWLKQLLIELLGREGIYVNIDSKSGR